jgi:hypothetical protein
MMVSQPRTTLLAPRGWRRPHVLALGLFLLGRAARSKSSQGPRPSSRLLAFPPSPRSLWCRGLRGFSACLFQELLDHLVEGDPLAEPLLHEGGVAVEPSTRLIAYLNLCRQRLLTSGSGSKGVYHDGLQSFSFRSPKLCRLGLGGQIGHPTSSLRTSAETSRRRACTCNCQ